MVTSAIYSGLDNAVCRFDRSTLDAPGPCVLFATPGMISGGFSLEVFKHWAPFEQNLVTLPGYCVAGTIGHKLMSGKPTKIDLDKDTQIDVRCQIHQLSFSPHTDAKGIMDLIKFLSPQHVILVHGEKPKMATLKERIQSELGTKCYYPANHESVTIPSTHYIKADASNTFIQSCLNPNFKFLKPCSQEKSDTGSKSTSTISPLQIIDERVSEGILVLEKSKKAKIVQQYELLAALGKEKHEIQFAYCFPVNIAGLSEIEISDPTVFGKSSLIRLLTGKISGALSEVNVQNLGEFLQGESFRLSVCLKENCPYRIKGDLPNSSETVFFCCSWLAEDDKLAWRIISIMENSDASAN